MMLRSAPRKWMIAAAATALAGSSALVYAQIEGPTRGVPPIASTGDFEVGGVEVNVTGKDAEDARRNGWMEAQRLAWSKLWARTHGGQKSSLPDSRLNEMVSAIVVEDEEIGPRRYVARLGVVFDRARAGQLLGVSGTVTRSAPLMVIPVTINAGAPMVYEQQTDWQRAWARYRTAESTIDYIRPNGGGGDSLVLTAGQIDRRGRIWWRVLLDQFGAADILIPVVKVERQWPGGPVKATFTARYGPDNKFIEAFALRTTGPGGIPKMMDEGVRRVNEIYQRALSSGMLAPDKSLIVQEPIDESELTDVEEPTPPADTGPRLPDDYVPSIAPTITGPGAETAAPPSIQSFNVQFASPDASAVTATESAVRSTGGVQAATTSSLALGGTSVMRVTFAGDREALRAALASRGFTVSDAGGALRISR